MNVYSDHINYIKSQLGLHPSIHKYMYHGSTSVLQRKQEMEQVIHTQNIQNFYNVKCYTYSSIMDHLYT